MGTRWEYTLAMLPNSKDPKIQEQQNPFFNSWSYYSCGKKNMKITLNISHISRFNSHQSASTSIRYILHLQISTPKLFYDTQYNTYHCDSEIHRVSIEELHFVFRSELVSLIAFPPPLSLYSMICSLLIPFSRFAVLLMLEAEVWNKAKINRALRDPSKPCE